MNARPTESEWLSELSRTIVSENPTEWCIFTLEDPVMSVLVIIPL